MKPSCNINHPESWSNTLGIWTEVIKRVGKRLTLFKLAVLEIHSEDQKAKEHGQGLNME